MGTRGTSLSSLLEECETVFRSSGRMFSLEWFALDAWLRIMAVSLAP